MQNILNAIASHNPDTAARESWIHINTVAKIADEIIDT